MCRLDAKIDCSIVTTISILQCDLAFAEDVQASPRVRTTTIRRPHRLPGPRRIVRFFLAEETR
jgi:hypothetical protein